MTAEIAIVNQSAVALAADSAVTVGKDRVWKSSNKLFPLSPVNDIGIMIYGSADFISFPWETIIKQFRSKIGKRKFETVNECKENFIEYLGSNEYSDEDMEELSANLLIIRQIVELGKDFDKKPLLKFRNKLRSRLKSQISELEEEEIISELSFDDFRDNYEEQIIELAKGEYQCHLTKELRDLICRHMFESFRREGVTSAHESGVVFAGFGSKEIFPVVIHCVIDGKNHGYLRHWNMSNSCNFNETRSLRGTIIPFAQNDMTQLFLEGIFSRHVRWISTAVKAILDKKAEDLIGRYVSPAEQIVEKRIQADDNKKMTKALMEKFHSFRKSSLVDPVMKIIANLPKEDMAQMAEALVELTSLRRKVGSDIQSVSGPVDVAIISKGDGFIWIKRKHYFNIDVNKDFLYRKYGAFETEEEKNGGAGEKPA